MTETDSLVKPESSPFYKGPSRLSRLVFPTRPTGRDGFAGARDCHRTGQAGSQDAKGDPGPGEQEGSSRKGQRRGWPTEKNET